MEIGEGKTGEENGSNQSQDRRVSKGEGNGIKIWAVCQKLDD